MNNPDAIELKLQVVALTEELRVSKKLNDELMNKLESYKDVDEEYKQGLISSLKWEKERQEEAFHRHLKETALMREKQILDKIFIKSKDELIKVLKGQAQRSQEFAMKLAKQLAKCSHEPIQ